VIGEDSVLLREGIARILADAGFDVVAQAGDVQELMRKVRAHKPDVAVIDIRMPPDHTDEGVRAAREIRASLPKVGILVLSQYVDEHYALALLSDGADGIGYLLKDRVGEVDRFIDAIRRVAAGGSVLDPEVVAHMLGRRRDEGPLAELSAREREVLELMAQGLSNKAISEQLVVTGRAVEHHVTSIFAKLGLPASDREHRRVLATLTFLNNQAG
jgi:DNA-binding NarL/FixJ family response regulator